MSHIGKDAATIILTGGVWVTRMSVSGGIRLNHGWVAGVY
jgi:hypothetical protein